jgi:tetratricopeptide (TPR) repeat protein
MHRLKWFSLFCAASFSVSISALTPACGQPATCSAGTDSTSKTAAAANMDMAPKAMPGIEFTKVQDLDPKSRGANRPIKQKWAVVIGTSRFKEARLTPSDAMDMGQSAKDFESYLVDPHGGRFDRSHVKVLVDAGASKQAISTAIGPNFLGGAGKDDLVVVYLATSAFPTTDGNTYLCTYDCALDNIYGTCISMQSIMSTLKENIHSDRILLVLQAGYSGAAELDSGAKSLAAPVASKSAFNFDLQKAVLGNGFIILSSSQPNEMTWSTAFSRNLTKALRQEDGMISLNKAFEIAKKSTETETSAAGAGKKQVPVMKSSWTGSDLVVGALPAERVANLPASVSSFLSAEGSYLKANQALSDGKIDEALEQYKLAVIADPNYADAVADWGAALTMKGDWKGAADMYGKAVAMRPLDELFHLNYARVLDKLGDKDTSLQELNTAYRLNPKDTSVLLALSNRSLATNQAADAVRYIEQAVDLYPNRSDLRERLSYALMKSGDVDQASAQAKEAVHLDPKSASAQTTLGSVLMVQNYITPAVDAYKEAARLNPQDANICWLLSRCLEKNGERDNAIAELQRFLQLCSPSDARGVQAREHLEELKSRK